jgi:hypothetical protein
MLALAVAVALAACLLALLATKPAEAAGRYKVVTKTFSGAAEIQVPADTTSKQGPASPYPSEISVSGLKKGRVLVARTADERNVPAVRQRHHRL